MSRVSRTEAFEKEFRVTLEAEAIRVVNDEIIRRQREREGNREFLMGLQLGKLELDSQDVFCRVSDPLVTNHAACFMSKLRTEAVSEMRVRQKILNQELKGLVDARKACVKRLVELAPDTTTMGAADLRLLLKKSGVEDDEDDDDDDDDDDEDSADD